MADHRLGLFGVMRLSHTKDLFIYSFDKYESHESHAARHGNRRRKLLHILRFFYFTFVPSIQQGDSPLPMTAISLNTNLLWMYFHLRDNIDKI